MKGAHVYGSQFMIKLNSTLINHTKTPCLAASFDVTTFICLYEEVAIELASFLRLLATLAISSTSCPLLKTNKEPWA